MKNKTLTVHRILSGRVSIGVAALLLCVVNGCIAGKSGQQSASAQSRAKDSFDLADAKHDGKLSREEAGDYLVYMVFTARDKNRDGRLTQAEFAAGDRNQIAAFKERDRNEDGFVTIEEALIYGRRGGGAVALMRRADKNGDGKLDRAEIETYARQH
jgi:Ca2+-binding EF-hand superfamily protein